MGFVAAQHTLLASLNLLQMSAPSVGGSPVVEPLRLQWLQLTCVCVPEGWVGRALSPIYCRTNGGVGSGEEAVHPPHLSSRAGVRSQLVPGTVKDAQGIPPRSTGLVPVVCSPLP